MGEKLVIWLLESREAGLSAYLLVTMVLLGLALHKEWIVLGHTHNNRIKALESQLDKQTPVLESTANKLTEQRILNAQTATSVAYMQRELDALEAEKQELAVALARAEGRRAERKRPTT